MAADWRLKGVEQDDMFRGDSMVYGLGRAKVQKKGLGLMSRGRW